MNFATASPPCSKLMKNILTATFTLILSVGAFAQNTPMITTQPSSQTNLAGGNAAFTVSASGAGPFTYQWRFDGTNLPNLITTVAGGGSGGDGGAAANANLNQPTGVAVDGAGSLFIAEQANNRIRKVGTNGIISTVAGNGTWGYSGDGGAAANAELAGPFGVAVDAFGNLYIGDTGNNRIRKVGTNGIITSVPGAFSGDGGGGTNGILYYPFGVAVDASGNVFFADGNKERIRKLGTNGIITTVAGNGSRGYSGDGGAATNAALNSPFGVAVDALGNLFVADTQNSLLRKVGTNGIITTVAGGGVGGDGGPAINASLAGTYGVTVDGLGNLFIATAGNIRKVGTNGIITTVAGGGGGGDGGAATNASLAVPYGVAVDGNGNVFIADYQNSNIRKVIAQGPMLALDNVGASTAGNYDVVVTSPFGSITSSVASLTVHFPPAITQQPQAQSVAVGGGASFNVSAIGTSPLSYQWYFGGAALAGRTNSALNFANVGFTNAGGYDVVVTNLYGSMTSSVATLSAGYPPTLATEPTNQTALFGSNVTLNVAMAGAGPFAYQWQLNGSDLPNLITTVAGGGNGGAATNASLHDPTGVAVDASGNLFIADKTFGLIRKVDINGVITTMAGGGTNYGDDGAATNASLNPSAVAVDSSGNLFIADANGRIRKVGTNGIITTVAATNTSLAVPSGVAVDASGNLFIADTYNQRILKVNVNGIITTVAGNGYVNPDNGEGAYSGDGSAATNARLNYPYGVAVDASGNLFIADSNNGRIRKVNVNGIITTVAGGGANYPGNGGAATNAVLYAPTGVAVDASGNLFLADAINNLIRKVDVNGIITTVAGGGANYGANYPGDGGAAIDARLNYPSGVAVDASGNLFIADTRNSVIRKVDVKGIITTVAGNGSQGYSGDGGAATNASLNGPTGVAVDASGNLFIADSNNYRIRKVNVNGIISTVAGNGVYAYSGDGGAATNASLNYPSGVAVDASGNLFIADKNNNRIRKVDVAGLITTVAGNGGVMTNQFGQEVGYFSGDGGAAINATLNAPEGVAVDASGNLFIADIYNQRIRKVDVNGAITTVAGNGYVNPNTGAGGYFGDGGAATSASLNFPSGVTVDASGDLFIADSFNNRIREVALGDVPKLALDNVFAGNAGNYQVIIINPYGSVTSSVASLTVLLPPTSQIPGKVMSVPLVSGNNVILGFSLSQTTSASLLTLLQAPAVNGPWTTNTAAVLTRNAQTGGYQFAVPVTGSVGFYQLRSL